MPEENYTEVAHRSLFQRLGGAIKGVFLGVVLIVVAFPVLFFNEGRAVKRYKTLKQGEGSVVSIKAGTVNPANEGKLIHVFGMADTDDILTDPEFGVSANALRLKRIVEMLQWAEDTRVRKKKKIGGGSRSQKSFSYKKEWSGRLIDSSDFNNPHEHKNPGSKAFASKDWIANKVLLGAFQLPSALVHKLHNFSALNVSPKDIKGGQYDQNVRVMKGGHFFIGTDPADPQIGDLRIFYKLIKPQKISVVGQQINSTLAPYSSETGGEIALVQPGVHSAKAMFQEAGKHNRVLTWVLRGAGFLLLFVGLMLVLRPMAVIADVVPFLGYIVETGTGIVALLFALALSLLVIGISWVVFRPLIGGILFLFVLISVALIWKKIIQTQHVQQPK